MEIWKDIPNYEGLYKASTLGNVVSLRKGFAILKTNKNQKYKSVSLYKNKKQKVYKVHQLIAITFMEHKPCRQILVVDHINNDKHDNRLENLQIIDQRTNSNKDKLLPKSGIRGVYWSINNNQWQTRMRVCGRKINIFYSEEKQKCQEAYIYFFDLIETLRKTHHKEQIRHIVKEEVKKYRLQHN